MDPILDKILAASPWAAPIVAIVLLLRKELAALLLQSPEAPAASAAKETSANFMATLQTNHDTQMDLLKQIADNTAETADSNKEIVKEIIRNSNSGRR